MLQQLLQSVAPRQFYETLLGRTLPAENKRGDVAISCPFHEKRVGRPDETGSMSISMNPENAGMYHCFGGTCGASGTILKFYQEYREAHGVMINGTLHKGFADFRVVARELVTIFNLDPESLERALVDDGTLATWSNALYNTPEGKRLMEHIETKRCLSRHVIQNYRLGLNESGRLTIPITDLSGSVVNVRQWLPEYGRTTPQLERAKIISLPGVGQSRLYPIDALREQFIVICEGELDALVLHSLGVNAITSTGGAGSFSKAWYSFFQDKDVVLMFDTDHAGQSATDELLMGLYEVVRSIKSVDLGTAGKDIKDVTDYVAKVGKDSAPAAIRYLMETTPSFFKHDQQEAHYNVVNLFQAGTKGMINQHVSVTALIAGKDQHPFAIPKRIRVTCTAAKASNSCPGCPKLLNDSDSRELLVELDSDMVVKLVQSGNSQAVIRDMFGITCKTCKFTLEEYETVEEVQLIPDTDTRLNASYEYIIRNAYIVGYGSQLNHPYELKGRTIVDPNARVTHVFNRSVIKNKILTDVTPKALVLIDGEENTVEHHLRIFKTERGQTINDKLIDIYSNLEGHVTRIVQRRDLTQAIDLCYHSPIAFNFGKVTMPRGWMSALVIGDSQCGKSETADTLRMHYRLGEMYGGENLTRAGIVGAYAELPGKRGVQFRLGVGPLNDGGLLMIDEAGGLSQDQFDELTMLRSTGMAESTKYGQHNRHPARLRMIMLGNPRGSGQTNKGRSMSSYIYGCLAVKELVGGDADIARFDIFVTVAADEVKYSDINAPLSIHAPLIYTSDLCNLLIQWVWSRRASDWEFSQDAQSLILKAATEMAEQYDPSIPIVAGGSQRWTIARVAASIAARLYSTDDGFRVLVNTEHVEAAIKFLYDTYNKPSMMYHVYSSRRRAEETVADPKALMELMTDHPYTLWAALRELTRFSGRDFSEATGIDSYTITALMPKLKVLRVLYQSGGYWYTTAGFRKFVQSGVYKHPEEHRAIDAILEKPKVEGDANSSY